MAACEAYTRRLYAQVRSVLVFNPDTALERVAEHSGNCRCCKMNVVLPTLLPTFFRDARTDRRRRSECQQKQDAFKNPRTSKRHHRRLSLERFLIGSVQKLKMQLARQRAAEREAAADVARAIHRHSCEQPQGAGLVVLQPGTVPMASVLSLWR
jgi:hypothetical protein